MEAHASIYELQVAGRLDERWLRQFGPLDLTFHANDITVIRGAFIDQAALFGVLNRIRDLGLELILLKREPEIQ